MPWAKTVHGLTPIPAEINNVSPSPKRVVPIKSMITEIKGGLSMKGFGALQNRLGIFLIFKKFNNFCSYVFIIVSNEISLWH